MSKRIVLKSVVAIVMAGFVLSVSSCKKEDDPKKDDPKKESPKESTIVGKWKSEKVEASEFECSVPALTSGLKSIIEKFMEDEGSIGINTEMDFTSDGKVISSIYGASGATYNVSGNKLTITAGSLSTTYDVTFPNSKTMYCEEAEIDSEMLGAMSDVIQQFLTQMGMPVEVRITKCRIKTTLAKVE